MNFTLAGQVDLGRNINDNNDDDDGDDGSGGGDCGCAILAR